MSLPRSLVSLALVSAVGLSSVFVVGCGGGGEAKTAKVASGPMPEGEAWTGVYFHPVFGYLHLVEEGSSIVGRWKRANQSKWGELSGTATGNVLHYQWKEHTIGMVGPSSTSQGKGYFQYKMDKENRPVLDGKYGLDDSEVGGDWSSIKQVRMTPDIKSIGGDGEGAGGGF